MVVATRRQAKGLPPLPKASAKKAPTESLLSPTRQTRTPQSPSTGSGAACAAPAAVAAAPKSGSSSKSKPSTATMACGETKTTQAQSESHFLRGLELGDFTDALSIPDPPSPSKPPARRFSMPSPHPLREISNASDTEEEGQSNVTTRRKKNKKKRKTMFGLHAPPAPQPSAQPDNNNNAALLNHTATATSTPASTPVQMKPTKTAAQHHESEPSTKRRKKRQSIVLPSDLDPTEANNNNDDGYTKTYAAFKNDPSPPATPARQTKTPTKPATNSLADIRSLVHEYTALPKSQRSTDLASAQELLMLTGYAVRSCPVTSPSHPPQAPAELSREQKLGFLSRLGPDLQRMDACKVSDAKMVAQVTQCRPEKVRGGFYRYHHSETGRQVSPEEFEQRYMVMLDEVNQFRSENWLEYFNQLREEDNSSETDTEDDLDVKIKALPRAHNDNNNAFSTPQAKGRSPSTKVPEEESGESDDDDGMEATVSEGDGEHVLPFPDRDEVSSDPRIARAERKLWNTIDKALAEYSAEVMAAQKDVAASRAPAH